jgi:hypothetical protein
MTSGSALIPFLFQFTGKNSVAGSVAALAQRATANGMKSFKYSLTYGTGSGQIDTVIAQVYELAASASNEHNFFDGTVKDIFSQANGLTNLKYLGIYLTANSDSSTAGSSATIGNASANQLVLYLGAAAQTYTIYSGGPAYQAGRPAGYTVDATHKLFKVLNNDGANKLTYWLLGCGVKL